MIKYEDCEKDFDVEWRKMQTVYGAMLSAKTMKLVKLMAKTLYVQGRVDGMITARKETK